MRRWLPVLYYTVYLPIPFRTSKTTIPTITTCPSIPAPIFKTCASTVSTITAVPPTADAFNQFIVILIHRLFQFAIGKGKTCIYDYRIPILFFCIFKGFHQLMYSIHRVHKFSGEVLRHNISS